MIVYIPYYSKESSIYDIFDEIKEFESVDKMKEYLCNLPNRLIKINANEIVIDDRFSYEDKRLGWQDTRYVCLKEAGEERVIGYCATKYKKLQEVFNFQNLDRNSKENNGPVLTKKLTSLNK